MTLEAMQSVLNRAASDPQFCKLLLKNPDKALAGYDLTAAEINQLKAMDAEALSGGGDASGSGGSSGPGVTGTPDAKAYV